jgi:SOS response regulatory protein OraA/RecX
MPLITRIDPSKRNPKAAVLRIDGRSIGTKAAVLRIDGRSIGTLRLSTIKDLGLRTGMECPPDLLARIRHAIELEATVDLAMTWLNRRALSQAQVQQKLEKRAVPAPLIVQAVSHLRNIGALDDTALATRAVEQLRRKGPVGAKLAREKLARRGLLSQPVTEHTAEPERALIEEPSRDEIRLFLRQKLQEMKALSPQKRRRRLASYLAQRGIEEFTAIDLLNEIAPDASEFES